MSVYGIDVSHWQRPSQLPWAEIAQTAFFCICRAGYGTARDREVTNHMREARAHGMTVGLYHFFRPSQPVVEQFNLFNSVVADVGCKPGDIIPFVDIEKDPVPSPGTEVSPAWSDPARELVELIAAEIGEGACGVYVTQREFKMMGSPEWVLHRPLWVAHYRDSDPASPGNLMPHIHQHRVGPYIYNGRGGVSEGGLVLDQNRALKPLPLIPQLPIEPDAPTPRTGALPGWIGAPQLGLDNEAYDELSDQRKKHNLES